MESGLLVIGISHHTAPVEIRERFSVAESRLYPSLHRLIESPGVEEIVLLSTCNRTEFILWCSDLHAASDSVRGLLADEFSLDTAQFGHFYRFTGTQALRHVFRVAASLDSLIVGEPQIVAQVKAAWAKARQAGTTGRYLDRIFQKALSVSKHVRSETAIGATPVSIPYAAVALARRLFSGLGDRNVMLIGSGKMSEISARHLLSAGAGKLWVTNRTYEHAETLAKELGGTPVRYEDRWAYLAEADIILSSTGCPHIIFGRAEAERVRGMRGGRPLFLIDIAVPRDIDPAIRDLPGFFLYDIDDLQHVVSSNLEGRLAAAAEAEKMIARETESFGRQIESERVVPTIAALRAHFEEIRLTEVARLRTELGKQGQMDEAALDTLSGRIMDRLARDLARELKQTEKLREQDDLAGALRRLFNLEEQKPTPVIHHESEPVSEPEICPHPVSA